LSYDVLIEFCSPFRQGLGNCAVKMWYELVRARENNLVALNDVAVKAMTNNTQQN